MLGRTCIGRVSEGMIESGVPLAAPGSSLALTEARRTESGIAERVAVGWG